MTILEPEETLTLKITNAEQQSQRLIELLDKAYIESAAGKIIVNFEGLIDGLTDYATTLSHIIEYSLSDSDVRDLMVSFKGTDTRQTHLGIIRDGYSVYISLVEELEYHHYCSTKLLPLSLLSSLTNWIVYYKYILGISLKSLSTTEDV